MKDISIIFFLLIFSAQAVFGQTSNSPPQISGEESSEQPPSETKAETVDENNDEMQREEQAQWAKRRRILKIVNDYELGADEVLTTLIIIAGDVRLQGRVTENVLVLGGDIELAPGSQVNGTLQMIDGQASGNTAGVANLQVSNDWAVVPAAVRLVMHPYIFWKITDDQKSLRSILVRSGFFLLMYLVIAIVFPRPLGAIGGVLARRPIGSILFGVLLLPVIPLIFIFLTLSIVGVPFMLLGLALLVPLAVCGKTAIFLMLSSTIISGRLKPLGVIFSYILYFMATSLPHIDWVTFLLVNAISIGLCLLSGIRAMFPRDPRRNTYLLPGSGWGSRAERI